MNKSLHLFIIIINVMIFIVALLLIAYAFSGLNEVHGIDNRYIYIKTDSIINKKIDFKKYNENNRLFLLVNGKKMSFRYDISYDIDNQNQIRLVDEISNISLNLLPSDN